MRASTVLLSLLMPLCALGGEAATSTETTTAPGITDTAINRWSVALAFGNFDVDTSDSDDPHLNEVAYTLLLGYEPWRFIGLDAGLLHIETAREFDEFDELTAFGATGVTLSARLQLPLQENITPYLRVGYSSLMLDSVTQLRDEPLATEHSQPLFGGGIRAKNWFVEYVNYGKVDELYLEQLRAGFLWRF